MSIDTTKIIKVLDAERGKFETTELNESQGQQLTEQLAPYPRDRRGRITINHEDAELLETTTGGLSTANFPDLLRQGIQFDAFSGYNEMPVTYPLWARVVDSNKQMEEYLKDAALGIAPVVDEGEQYPEAPVNLNDGVKITNHKRGYIVTVTEEMQKFDQVGKVRQLGDSIGRSLRLTEEQAAMDVLTTAGNYTRNSTTNDNDVGANTAATTLSPSGLITAYTTIATAKDRKTGVKLGARPNVLISGPLNQFYIQQLIRSTMTTGQGDAAATVVYGGGVNNPFFSLVDTIIISPYFGSSYQWALLERGRAVTFQRVEPMQILNESMSAATSSYVNRDVIKYRGRTWFGVGMVDDRFAYFSSSTTAPTIV